MYLNLFKRWLGSSWDGLFPRGIRRSSALPIVVILMVVVMPIVAWKLHRLGRFGALKREIKGEVPMVEPVGPRPGGLEPIVLTREQTLGSNAPEFHSVTLLPGMGMEVLQITAFVPSKGEVELLTGPTVKDIVDGTTPRRVGPNDRWGAIELPWSGPVSGVVTPVGSGVRTNWHGKTLEAPTDILGKGIAEGGMLTARAADTMEMHPEGKPTTATATFRGTDFEGHWTAKNDVTVTVTLSARTIDISATVQNMGDQAEPMGIGWHPRFVLPSGNRDASEVRLPNGDKLEIGDHVKGTPSGRIVAPGPAMSRLQQHPGALGVESLDESVVHPRAGLLDALVSTELRDLASEVGLRLSSLSDTVKQVRVASPAGAKYISLGMQTNYDDPFGKEWSGLDVAIATLPPSQTMQWKVRLEIFPISAHMVGR
jgi:aldose 1-epimerase